MVVTTKTTQQTEKNENTEIILLNIIKTNDKLENKDNGIENRIITFLEENGIKYKSPWEKFYDFLDIQRKPIVFIFVKNKFK